MAAAAELPPPGRGGPWPFLLALLTLTAMLGGVLLYVFETVRRAPGAALEGGRAVLAQAERVAAAFHRGTITTSFTSYATEVEGASRLQFATLRQMELFERTDAYSILWGTVDLPEIIVSARAPVEITYYLDLDERWEFERDGDRVRVRAPRIRFNRPSIDASAIAYEVRRGSLLRDEAEALRRLKGGITQMSLQRARENVPLVREVGRQRTESFVGGWLAQSFADGADYRVEVAFRDELEDEAPLTIHGAQATDD